jgi:lysine biosynthesis protein LysW
MYWFKQCPRCGGDLVVENDQYGIFVSCMQCGMCKDVVSEQIDPAQISLEPVPAPIVPQPESGTGTRRRMSHGGRHSYRSVGEPAIQSMTS